MWYFCGDGTIQAQKKGEIIQRNWFNNAVSEKKTLVGSNEKESLTVGVM